MSNQRKVERKKLIKFTPVYDYPQKRLLGYLGDLTLQGAMMLGEKPMAADQTLTLMIAFHQTPETPATQVIQSARVAWCRQEKDSSFFNTGVEFLNLTANNQIIIEAILERYQFRREPQDLFDESL
ncbi:MAG TPA: PilZ domain-containing protein [Anaerolineaceae bacterium]|nr:PilZ domain-containing protein [Anaerolineaceae bacterium]